MAVPEKKDGGLGWVAVGVAAAVGIGGAAIGYFLGRKTMEEHYQSHTRPSKKYNTGNCPICLSEMEELNILPCGHQYHNACIENMMKSGVAQNCPVCRKYFGK